MAEKIVVYTAISGCCGTLRKPEFFTPDVDYVCFSDNPHLRSDVWSIRPLPPPITEVDGVRDYVRQAKIPKILPHKFLSEYSISLWVDENFHLLGDLRELIRILLAENDLGLFCHPEARANIEAEVEACIRLKKDSPERLKNQIDTYRELGFPMDCRIPTCCGVIARRHHSPKIVTAMHCWWDEILSHSRRDQISFPYIAWKNNLSYKIIEENVRNNRWLLWEKHEIKKQTESLQRNYKNADVNFISFPKSGRTWVRYFLASYLNKNFGVPFDIELPPSSKIPTLSFKHDYAQLYQDCPGEPRILFPNELRSRRLVVLVRDPRDVAVSYYYQKGYREGFDFKDINQFILSDIYGIKRQARFVNLLLDFFEVHPGPKLLLLYECLHAAPEKEYIKLVKFLYDVVDEKIIEKAVAEASFGSMQAKEIEIARSSEGQDKMGRLGVSGSNFRPNALKARKGRVGGYNDEISIFLKWRIALLPEVRKLISRLFKIRNSTQ